MAHWDRLSATATPIEVWVWAVRHHGPRMSDVHAGRALGARASSVRHLLRELAVWADWTDLVASVPASHLADRLAWARQTVYRTMDLARELGWVSSRPVRRRGAQWDGREYRLLVPAGLVDRPAIMARIHAARSRDPDATIVHDVVPGVARGDTSGSAQRYAAERDTSPHVASGDTGSRTPTSPGGSMSRAETLVVRAETGVSRAETGVSPLASLSHIPSLSHGDPTTTSRTRVREAGRSEDPDPTRLDDAAYLARVRRDLGDGPYHTGAGILREHGREAYAQWRAATDRDLRTRSRHHSAPSPSPRRRRG